MRPLARWTFGKVKDPGPGEETLLACVKRFKVVYPEFDCIICYNNVSNRQLAILKKLNVDLHKQTETELEYPLESVNLPEGWKGAMPGWGFKLCPPRLRLESHELWIDNDVVIRERLRAIDRWLKSDGTLIASGHNNNRKIYGKFDHLVPSNVVCCAGLFGLPPGFDFESRIVQKCHSVLGGKPLGYYDEQGLVSAIVIEHNPHIVIPANQFLNVKEYVKKPFPSALHFIGANRFHSHREWQDYRDQHVTSL